MAGEAASLEHQARVPDEGGAVSRVVGGDARRVWRCTFEGARPRLRCQVLQGLPEDGQEGQPPVNLSLAAIDNLYRFLGLGRPDVKREEMSAPAPRALSPDEQKRLLKAVARSPSTRDRAVATLFFYSALRLEELAALDADNMVISARKGSRQK